MPEINFPERIIFGKAVTNKLRPEACDHAIIICDSDMLVNRGFLDKIKAESTKIISHVSTVVNTNVHELYSQASEIFFEKEAQLIIAAGSSAAIDCGTLLSFEGKTKLTAIPCCGACAMTDFENNAYFSYRRLPDTVVLDSSIISCVPSGMLAYDGMSCLAFAVDALCHTDNIIAKDLALAGAVGILKNIIPAYRGNIDALERMMYAMCFAVVAHHNCIGIENSSLSKVGSFFAQFGYPCSSVCALTLPVVLESDENFPKESLAEIAVESGLSRLGDFTVAEFADEIRKIQAQLNIPRSISGFGLGENEYRTRRSDTSVPDDLLDLCYYGSFKFLKI